MEACGMDEAKPMKWKIAAAAGGLVLVVLLVALALKADLVTASPPAATGPLKIVTFEDGGELEIFGVSVGERVVEVSPAKKFSLPFFHSKGSSSGTGGGLNVDTENEDRKVIRCRLRSNSRRAMLMEFRLKESNGMAMTLPAYLSQQDMVSQDTRISNTSAPTGFFNPKDGSLETLRDAMAKAGLQVLIQHRDLQSGWVNFMGPSLYHEPWPDRYIAALTAWQRGLPTLDFRVIRADGEVAEFSLPNPDFHKAPTSGAVKALPFVHNAGDFELTMKQVTRFATVGDHPFASVDLELSFKGTPVPGLKDGPVSFDGAPNGAADEWGNVVDFRRGTIRKKTSFGAFLPANSKRMTLDLVVRRGENYPLSADAGFMILEGEVTADGLEVDFKPETDAALFGIKTMPPCVIKPASMYWVKGMTKDWKQIEFRIQCEGGDKELEMIQRRIGMIGTWQTPVFLGEDNESSGLSFAGQNGGCGSGGGRFNFQRQNIRIFPPELLKPGAKVRIGVHPPPRNEALKFDLELPELVQPR